MQIRKVTDEPMWMKILLYGPEGTGKTTYASSSYRLMGKTLVAAVEGGTDTVRSWPIDVIDEKIKRLADLERLARELADGKHPEYKTIVIDSVTEIISLELAAIAKDAKKKNADRDIDDNYQDDYRVMTSRARRVFRMLRDLDRHVVMIALAKFVFPPTKKNESQKPPISIEPFMTTSISQATRGLVDFVWYMYTSAETGERCIITSQSGIVKAKTRGLRFAPHIGQMITTKLTVEDGVPRVTPDLSDLFAMYTAVEST